jgi:hypothetical protein
MLMPAGKGVDPGGESKWPPSLHSWLSVAMLRKLSIPIFADDKHRPIQDLKPFGSQNGGTGLMPVVPSTFCLNAN